nr:PREDICTED: uncharacterized protein LOC107078856 [Lepisosteus oculatus]
MGSVPALTCVCMCVRGRGGDTRTDRDFAMSAANSEQLHRSTLRIYGNLMEQFNPGLQKLASLGRSYVEAFQALTVTSEAYFSALAKMGEQALHSMSSRSLGDVIIQISECQRRLTSELEGVFCWFHAEVVQEMGANVKLDTDYISVGTSPQLLLGARYQGWFPAAYVGPLAESTGESGCSTTLRSSHSVGDLLDQPDDTLRPAGQQNGVPPPAPPLPRPTSTGLAEQRPTTPTPARRVEADTDNKQGAFATVLFSMTPQPSFWWLQGGSSSC